jgi:hypothetical protein
VSRMSAGTRPPQLAALWQVCAIAQASSIDDRSTTGRGGGAAPCGLARCDADNSVAIARAGDARDLRPGRECPPRNHLNCGIVGTVMRGGAIGGTPEAFLIPLGSVI